MKVLPAFRLSSLWGWMPHFLGSGPGFVEAGEAGGHQSISKTTFLVSPIFFKWKGAIFHCINQVNTGRAVAVGLYTCDKVFLKLFLNKIMLIKNPWNKMFITVPTQHMCCVIEVFILILDVCVVSLGDCLVSGQFTVHWFVSRLDVWLWYIEHLA